ncbi:MAG TPA: fumarylacetoacetase, partial [Gemmatimonadaceae bacterium]|nr:fumarylacetoacetase [Gemmatimonadaceae bacterium]
MSRPLDGTHDAARRSWVASANAPDTEFPIQNLPFGVFRRRGSAGQPCVGVAIGDQIVDVASLVGRGLVNGDALPAARACEDDSLNELMGLGPDAAGALRRALSDLLRAGGAGQAHAADLLVPMADAELFVPARVGDYTDFYASIYHATNVGSMFRPD